MSPPKQTDVPHGEEARLAEPLDASNPPPSGRFCDLVLQGGVINGVAYPGFLIEVARRYKLHAVGGASVGAIAAAIAVACEYGRRYGDIGGYNEGLRKMPEELAEWMDDKKSITRIRSLFQPEPKLKSLFNFGLDVVEASANREESPSLLTIFYNHFLAHRYWVIGSYLALLCLALKGFSWAFVFFASLWIVCVFVIYPICNFIKQVKTLSEAQGFGMCSGMSKTGSPHALTEWLYKGIQDAAGLPYARPLTFANLWAAPAGPQDRDGNRAERSIDLRTVTSCLNHGRVYEMPLKDPAARLFFQLSEFAKFFPTEVIDHLRAVAKPIDVATDPIVQRYTEREIFLKNRNLHSYTEQETQDALDALGEKRAAVIKMLELSELAGIHGKPDIRELPSADLPIVIAARLSLSVPILFQAIPMLGFDLEANAEVMNLCPLWFSDGGITNNFPIQLFDKALPRWPTFGIKVLEVGMQKSSSNGSQPSFVPYHHDRGSNDVFLIPPPERVADLEKLKRVKKVKKITTSWTTFGAFFKGLLQTAKDGNDQAQLRMPDVRNRVLRIYADNVTGGGLNLKISPEQIRKLAKLGKNGGLNLMANYLDGDTSPRYSKKPMWAEHRWVRFNLLINTLRKHLSGFEAAALNNLFQPSIFEQINSARQDAPLQSRDNNEFPLGSQQADQLKEITEAIIQLERVLTDHNLPLPYVPQPEGSLQYKPKT